MKKMILAVALVLGTASAFAFEPVIVDARNTTCAEVQQVLRAEGVVQMEDPWGDLQYHYSRMPSCQFGWVSQWTHVRTSDRRHCQAGYTCQPDYSGGPN